MLLNAHPIAGAEYLTNTEPDQDLSAWVFPIRGGGPYLLRDKTWADSISRDGSLIAYRATSIESGIREIWDMDLDGNHARKVLDNAASGLSWSPDGRRAWNVRRMGHHDSDAGHKVLSFAWEKDHVNAESPATDATPVFGMDNTFDIVLLPGERFLYSVRESGSIGSETCNF